MKAFIVQIGDACNEESIVVKRSAAGDFILMCVSDDPAIALSLQEARQLASFLIQATNEPAVVS